MKKIVVVLFTMLMILATAFFITEAKQGSIIKTNEIDNSVEEFRKDIISYSKVNTPSLKLEGVSIDSFNYKVYLDESMEIMASEDFLEDVIGCSVNRYTNGRVMVQRRDNKISFEKGSSAATVNGEAVKLNAKPYFSKDGEIYLPVSDIIGKLDYTVSYSLYDNSIDFRLVGESNSLPTAYDMRSQGRVTPVRDQGKLGTCWAFASLGALETTLMPEENNQYSVDHIALNNSYDLELNQGGEHTMSIAYLAAWQGPVYEKDDPYGDGETNTNLDAVKHLEEAIVIGNRDDEVIKGAIFKYGGVETSLYLHMEYGATKSDYYNVDTAAYYYNGEEKPNHDVVIVGWDDNYSRSNFKLEPEVDGAYICKNSWGTEFGDNGYFYVSYEDVNICQQSIVYSKLAGNNNFDKIYQSDLLGWVGQMGFGQQSAYFANAYTAGKNEELAAVSFYATGPDTEFSVYLVPKYENEESLMNRIFIASGNTRYAGYYTVKLDNPVRLQDNQKYAVIVHISTPGSTKPVAIEYNADDRTDSVDLSDGEGYVSLYGEAWHSAEKTQDCNICLKAFTNIVKEEDKDDTKLNGEAGSYIQGKSN